MYVWYMLYHVYCYGKKTLQNLLIYAISKTLIKALRRLFIQMREFRQTKSNNNFLYVCMVRLVSIDFI